MGEHPQPEASERDDDCVRLRRLWQDGEQTSIAAVIDGLGLWGGTSPRTFAAGELPRVMLNMVASVDGRATVEGRSAALSDRADRALFHGLRSAVDAVLVGGRTVRVERYGRLIPDAARRRLRLDRGLAPEPLACVVSNSLDLGDAPLQREAQARIVMLTASADSVSDVAAQVDYIRGAGGAAVDLRAALVELCARFGVQTVLCEGGPHLCCQLLAAGVVDELFLSLSPTLAGGDPAGEKALRILAGEEFAAPLALELLDVLSAESSLFLRYGVSERARVSRATIDSSSLAS